MTATSQPKPPVPAPPRQAPKPARPPRPICGANPGNGCRNTRRPNQLMCRRCWTAVPADIRRAIYDAYDPAAGIRLSPEWAAAVERAIDSLRPES